MKAIGVIEPDFMPRLFEVAEPIARPGAVVVDIAAASVSDFDRAAVGGRWAGSGRRPEPTLLGRDFVGTVAAVGEYVPHIDVGMRVAGVLPPAVARQPGTFAERVAVPADLLAPVPDGVNLAHVAAVGLAGITALDALDALAVGGLEILVIHGPVTGTGGFALELAKARGAVVAVVTPPRYARLAWERGADFVISEDASATNTIKRVRNALGGYSDAALHVAGDLAVAAGVVRPGGTFTSVGDALPPLSVADYVPTVVRPSGHKLADLLFKVAAGRLHSRVRRSVSFDQVVAPHDCSGGDADDRVVVMRA